MGDPPLLFNGPPPTTPYRGTNIIVIKRKLNCLDKHSEDLIDFRRPLLVDYDP